MDSNSCHHATSPNCSPVQQLNSTMANHLSRTESETDRRTGHRYRFWLSYPEELGPEQDYVRFSPQTSQHRLMRCNGGEAKTPLRPPERSRDRSPRSSMMVVSSLGSSLSPPLVSWHLLTVSLLSIFSRLLCFTSTRLMIDWEEIPAW